MRRTERTSVIVPAGALYLQSLTGRTGMRQGLCRLKMALSVMTVAVVQRWKVDLQYWQAETAIIYGVSP